MGLFVSIPDEFPTKSAWAYDAIPLLLSVICCGPAPSHLQASDDPTGSSMGLFVSIPDEFPTESAWTYDAIPLLLSVICRECHRRETFWTNLERIPAAAEELELSVPLPLPFLGGPSAFFLGPEDVSYRSRERLLQPTQFFNVLVQRGVRGLGFGVCLVSW